MIFISRSQDMINLPGIKKFLVISAVTQRTGSTLLQRIFNARKKTLIWGEHGGVISHFAEIERLTCRFSKFSEKEKRAYFNSNKPYQQWTANMTPDLNYAQNAIIKSLSIYLEELYKQKLSEHDVIGFKEVRYGRKELELLDNVFPNIIFILLVRNPVSTYESTYDSFLNKSLGKFIKQWNGRIEDYFELINKQNYKMFRFEDIISRNNKTLRKLSQIAMVNETMIHKVLNVKLKSTHSEISSEMKQSILSNCYHNMQKMGYL